MPLSLTSSFILFYPGLLLSLRFFLLPLSLCLSQISYSLLNDRSGDYQYFRIDPELGSIYTEAVFDRETKGSYLLEVKSVDGWESARPGKHGQPNSGEASSDQLISSTGPEDGGGREREQQCMQYAHSSTPYQIVTT